MKHHLKNFFIPHEGNDYHPHVLHTKRAIFYGGVFVFLKVLVVGFAVLLPMQVFVMPDVLEAEVSKIVIYTNQIRVAEGLPSLSGHTKLYISGQYKADDMAQNNYFEHTGPDGKSLKNWLASVNYDYTVAGENLAMGFFDAREVVDAWVKSPTHYANLIDPEFKELGIGIQAGEYNGVPTAYIAQHFGTQPVVLVAVEDEELELVEPIEEVLEESSEEGSPDESQPVETPEITIQDESQIVGEESVPETSVAGEMASAENVDTKAEEKIISPENESTAKPADENAVVASDVQTEVVTEPLPPVFAYLKHESFVSWKDVEGKTVLSVHAQIKGGIAGATVHVKEYAIPLHVSDELYVWQGELTVFDSSDSFFKPITMPSITIERTNGEMVQDNILWQNIKVVQPSPLEKYSRAETATAGFTNLFDVSRWVYMIAIVFFTVALALKILIEYHKQHHHIVLQTVLLIALLVILFEI